MHTRIMGSVLVDRENVCNSVNLRKLSGGYS